MKKNLNFCLFNIDFNQFFYNEDTNKIKRKISYFTNRKNFNNLSFDEMYALSYCKKFLISHNENINFDEAIYKFEIYTNTKVDKNPVKNIYSMKIRYLLTKLGEYYFEKHATDSIKILIYDFLFHNKHDFKMLNLTISDILRNRDEIK